jgi:DNA polymerase-3 subunit delta
LKTIINDINSKKFKNVYLFTGDEVFLMEYYANSMISALIDDTTDSFNYLCVSRQKPDIMETDTFINSYPFIKDKKVLLLKNTGILKKADDEEKKYFSSLLQSCPEYAVVIFMENEIDKRNAIYKAIESHGYIGNFPLQKGSSLTNWVQRIFKSYGKEIDSETAEYLISSCNEGMINIKNEIEKIAMCKRENNKITSYDINALVTRSVESKAFEMAEDIAKGDIKSAWKKTDDIKSLGIKPVEILPAIFSKFSSYRKIKILGNISYREIASKTGQREYFVKKDMNIIKNISLFQIDKILSLCQEADYKIKSGQSDGWTEIGLMLEKYDN